MAAQRRWHCELRRMLCPTPSLALSRRGFLLLRKPFQPSLNAIAEGKFRSAVYKTRGSLPSLAPSLPSLGEELFSLCRNAAEGTIEK